MVDMDVRTRMAAVAGLAALGLLGPVVAHPADAEETLDEARLREALLDHTDFPVGWAGDSRRSAEKRGLGVPRPEERSCRELFDSLAGTTARAGFARTPAGPFVTTVAAAHRDTAHARRAVASFEKAAEQCGTFHAREGPAGDAVTVAYRAAEQAADPQLGRLGEESVAVRFHRHTGDGSGTRAGTGVVADVVIVRVGSGTVRVAQAGRDDGTTGGMAGLADRAVDKLRQVSTGRTPKPTPDQPGATEL